MNTIGDIVVNVILQTITPLIVLLVASGANIATTISSLQLGAVTEQAAADNVAFSLPLIIFEPGELYINNNYVCLPMEIMAIACFTSAFILSSRATTWERRAGALFVGTFAPPMVVQVIDLLIYNVNLLLPSLSNNFFAVIPTNLISHAGLLAVETRIIRGEAGEAALVAVAVLAIYGGICIVSLFLLRAIFHIGGSVSSVLISIVALRSVLAGFNKKSMQNFFVFLASLFLVAILAQTCIGFYHSLWTYTAAIFYQYSDHFVLQPRINAFVSAVYEYLEATGGDVGAARSVIEGPVSGCVDSCSGLLRQQMGAATAAAVLPFLILVVVTFCLLLWFRGAL